MAIWLVENIIIENPIALNEKGKNFEFFWSDVLVNRLKSKLYNIQPKISQNVEMISLAIFHY